MLGELTVETVSRTDDGYVVAVNGRRCVVWESHDWAARVAWERATVRPLAVLNDLLAEAGVVPRLFTLYAGGNEGIAWLLDPRIVGAVAGSGLIPDPGAARPRQPRRLTNYGTATRGCLPSMATASATTSRSRADPRSGCTASNTSGSRSKQSTSDADSSVRPGASSSVHRQTCRGARRYPSSQASTSGSWRAPARRRSSWMSVSTQTVRATSRMNQTTPSRRVGSAPPK